MGKDFVIVINNDIRQPSMDRGPLVIRLPDGTKATVQFQVGMKINEVVKKVCDKRNLSAPDFHLKVIDGTTLASDTTVQELPNEELQLIPNVEESLIESSDSQTSSVSTALSAFKWKTFEVTYGKRRNFFIGIDGEYIQIFKKKTGFSKEKKVLNFLFKLPFIFFDFTHLHDIISFSQSLLGFFFEIQLSTYKMFILLII